MKIKLLTCISVLLTYYTNAQTWLPCNLAVNNNSTGGTAVCVHNNKLFEANNSDGLQVSTDNGATWTVVNAAINFNPFSSGVDLFSTGDRLYSVLSSSGCTHIQYSTDDGITFQYDTLGLPVCYPNAVTRPSIGMGEVAWNGHLMFSLAGPDWEFSRNTAKSGWDDANYFDANDCSEFFVKNDTCWAATNGATSNGVAWSVDGLNWTSPVSTGIPNFYVPTQIAWNNNRLIMMGGDVGAGNAGVDTVMKYSDDYGLTFKDRNIKKYLGRPNQGTRDIFFAYDHLYFTLANNLNGSAADLIMSTDGGQTFVADTAGFPSAVNTIFEIKDMAFLNGWAFAQLNSGDLFRKQIGTVSINESNAPDESFKIFPNPVDDVLTVSSTNKTQQMKIMDFTGKVLLEANTNTIDVSSLSSGIYLLFIKTDHNTYRTKFVKK